MYLIYVLTEIECASLFHYVILDHFIFSPVQDQPIPYNFEYGVKDEYAGTDFGQNEESDGSGVSGSYTVQLPDGRRQTVGILSLFHDHNFYV